MADLSPDFREHYERHVQYVLAGDTKSALADMVPESLPAAFAGVTMPTGKVTALRIVDVRREGEGWIGETAYDTEHGTVGLRSIWVRHDGRWMCNALQNFDAPAELPG